MKKLNRWCKEEIAFIHKNRKNYKIADLAKRTKRTFFSVQAKLNEIDTEGFDKIYGSAPTKDELELRITNKLKKKNFRAETSQPIVVQKSEPRKKGFRILWGLLEIWK